MTETINHHRQAQMKRPWGHSIHVLLKPGHSHTTIHQHHHTLCISSNTQWYGILFPVWLLRMADSTIIMGTNTHTGNCAENVCKNIHTHTERERMSEVAEELIRLQNHYLNATCKYWVHLTTTRYYWMMTIVSLEHLSWCLSWEMKWLTALGLHGICSCLLSMSNWNGDREKKRNGVEVKSK